MPTSASSTRRWTRTRRCGGSPCSRRASPVIPISRRWGDLRDRADWGNLHADPGGQTPSRQQLGAELAAARDAVAGAPLVVTETGYHNAVSQIGVQPPTSERAAAAYYPRLFLEHFAAGVRRTYAYELLDEKPEPGLRDQEQHFGLLRNDFTPKPAAESLRRLLALARGPEPEDGGDGGPRALDLEVASRTPLSRLVLRRADGRWSSCCGRPRASGTATPGGTCALRPRPRSSVWGRPSARSSCTGSGPRARRGGASERAGA